MDPTPILPHSVNLILHYISPPSQLSIPLPPHLISKDLLHRHHFLQPDTPDAYLCWPSPHQYHTIAFLENLHIDDDQCTTYPVRYVSDDQTYAHVAVTSGLRLIFQWDNLEGWKYHDAKLMPFPPGCYTSLQDAVNQPLVKPVAEYSSPISGGRDLADEDTYWDAYGQEEADEETSITSRGNHAQDSTEDDYWAQYAAVQGASASTSCFSLDGNMISVRLRGFYPPFSTSKSSKAAAHHHSIAPSVR